jgi:Cu(I)/Ag(I) efflux system membrane fusion protein
MNKKIVWLAMLAVLVVGVGAGYWLSMSQQPALVTVSETQPSEPDVIFWRNPMNPAITSPVFTQDEMGMDYIPVYADGGNNVDTPVGTVLIDPVTVQNIGVRTATVEQRMLTRQLSALGRVVFNEKRLARLHPKTSGWIEELLVDETGVQVDHDTILLSIYSPDLVAAQQEYLVALTNWESLRTESARSVVNSAYERLELFDMPAHQIKELAKSRKTKKYLHIHSPFQGKVMNIGGRGGQYVTPKDELYLIADLSRIWINVDVFEDELPWLKVGDQAEMHVRAVPGRTYQGQVTFIHPVMNSTSRTVQVRLEFDNSDLSLKPGMFANVVLYTDPQPEAVVVPSESIVRSGSRDQVFVSRGAGKFSPREVTLGISADGFTQILDGVEPGERVVRSGQFLIDSESKLREATAKMMAIMAAGERSPGRDVNDMSMDDMDMGDLPVDDGSASDMGGKNIDRQQKNVPESPGMDMSDMEMEH